LYNKAFTQMEPQISISHANEIRRIVTKERPDRSSRGDLSLALEVASDRARILYSSAFRRLQQKTQVFSLSTNAAVRGRLSHSLEVSDVGRQIVARLEGFFKPLGCDLFTAIALMVETACLMHDIGNPPFGHFAEVVIQRWFQERWARHYVSSTGTSVPEDGSGTISKLSKDFVKFDGNPQGIRITTRLQGRTKRERCEHGMNLTLSQLLTGLKYLASPSEVSESGKKAGFFESERDRVEYARSQLGIDKGRRFPLAYIVEVSDDISYCLSDIEDGIEQDVFDARDFFDEMGELKVNWREVLEIPSDRLNNKRPNRDDFFVFKTYFTRSLIQHAVRRYQERHESIMEGEMPSIFSTTDEEWQLLEHLKGIAGRHLYSSAKVELALRVGLEVVQGILDHFEPLLRLSKSQFDALAEARKTGDRKSVRLSKHDPELLLYDILPKTYIEIYESERDHPPNESAGNDWEWFCRVHLILDFLCGMTDDFALKTFHAFAGIRHDP
jgi:dGTPase